VLAHPGELSVRFALSIAWWIAETLRKSKSAVRRYLRELKQRGYIDIDDQFDKRGQTSNTYTILDQADLIACANQVFQDWEAKQKGG
jgi:predicted ArsR family transcriptional regulator